MKPKIKLITLVALFAVITGFINREQHTLYIIGDSTVRNTNGIQRGWGMFVQSYFDSTQLAVSNQAMAGRSTRTFIKEGRWEKVLSTLKAGDFVMMQFGHNEGSRPDTSKAGYRGVLKGTGDDVAELVWPDGKPETVHTYGWYIRKFVRDTKAKGATPIVLSMIPRNEFRDGKVMRADKDYGLWARQVAEEEGAVFVDLNKITADKYDAFGAEQVKTFFPGDHTHTNEAGAKINAQSVIDGVKLRKDLKLNTYLAK
ncbi:rhamnogalacturonan acetylesterase [Hufsiella ginkgonis]|uniref:rhamnogalacturonan acetylesterase n=1 Tax=Hufsiella ginkgonis TaxID=2695274 RepID=UPI0019290D64|nr:rhamnogalacturonan acetylesterase [Hufsiella ginkgonis]